MGPHKGYDDSLGKPPFRTNSEQTYWLVFSGGRDDYKYEAELDAIKPLRRVIYDFVSNYQRKPRENPIIILPDGTPMTISYQVKNGQWKTLNDGHSLLKQAVPEGATLKVETYQMRDDGVDWQQPIPDLGITGNIIAAILYDAATAIYRGFNDLFGKALEDTSRYFFKERGIEFRTDGLRKILEGKAEANEVEKLKTNDGFIDDVQLVSQLVQWSDLHFEDESQSRNVGQEILDYLIKRLEHYLMSDPGTGLSILLGYITRMRESANTGHSQVMDVLEKLSERMEDIMTQFTQHQLEELQEQVSRLTQQSIGVGRNHKIVVYQQQIEMFKDHLNKQMDALEATDPLREPERHKEIKLKIEGYLKEIDELEAKLERAKNGQETINDKGD